MGNLTPANYFSITELECHCGCGLRNWTPELLQLLNSIRDRVGRPIIINDCCRCPAHNRAVGGKPNSAHQWGWAADIHVENSRERFELIEALIYFGVKRFGVYRTFIHIDIAPEWSPAHGHYPQEVTWFDHSG